MSTIPERLEKLRAKMQEKGIDIYIIPTADFHQSEYVGEHFKAREYITGFTGSAGTAVVSKTEARLWTDGRYFIQAAKQPSMHNRLHALSQSDPAHFLQSASFSAGSYVQTRYCHRYNFHWNPR